MVVSEGVVCVVVLVVIIVIVSVVIPIIVSVIVIVIVIIIPERVIRRSMGNMGVFSVLRFV